MMVSTRRLAIGLAVGAESVRAVAMRSRRIVWAVERARGDEPLERTIAQLLADAPLARWPGARVIAAVGPAQAQTKRLAGLPPVCDRSRVGDVVRESASRFFLKNGVPLQTTWAAFPDGTIWGAAVEQPVIDAIRGACRGRRLRVAAVVPTVAVLGQTCDASATRRLVWKDGAFCAEITFDRGHMTAIRRVNGIASLSPAEHTFDPALECLGPDGSRFADALGAAQAFGQTTLGWPLDGRKDNGPSLPRWRLVVAGLSLMTAAGAWLAAPGLAARVAERSAAARLSALAPERREAVAVEREVAKLTAALGEVAAFDATRHGVGALLGDLTAALPDESAVTTLRMSGSDGSMMALTPRAAVLLTKLDGIRGVGGAEIVGPVTREVIAGKALDRVAVRFRLDVRARRNLFAAVGGEQ